MINFSIEINYYENSRFKPTELFVIYKPIFIDLLLLLKNDINNIKYDFTFMIIIDNINYFEIIKLLELYGYLHLLARINPNKYKWNNKKEKKANIYL